MSSKILVLIKSKDLFQNLYDISHDGFAVLAPANFDIDLHTTCYFVEGQGDQALSKFVHESAAGAVQLAYLDADYDFLKNLSNTWIKRVWFNPGGEIAPDPYPVQDAELRNLDQAIKMKVLLDKPSLAQCLGWLDEWGVPTNVRTHSDVVSWSAYVLAVKLLDKGITVDPVLTHRGGLLHDIDKIATLDMKGIHGRMGADFLIKQGYPQLAEIIREHIMTRIMCPKAKDWGWEVKLVYFCDKLVEGDNLVTFDTRLDALMGRYPLYVGPMLEAAPAIWALSDEICEILSIMDHEELIEMLKEVL